MRRSRPQDAPAANAGPFHLGVDKLSGMAAPYNPRTISDDDLAALARSMTTFGVVEPVVVNRRGPRIVGGHQRVRAAELAGLTELPVVWVDLDEDGERQLNLALNRIHGEWNEQALAEVLLGLKKAGADVSLAGFTPEEIDRLFANLEAARAGMTDPDAVPLPPDIPETTFGDLILLGQHRLLCGDSADPVNLRQLLGGIGTMHMVHTDPPYNVKVEPRSNNAIAASRSKSGARPFKAHHRSFDLNRSGGRGRKAGKMRARDRELENDFLPEEAFAILLRIWFKHLAQALMPGRAFYLWGGYSNIKNYPQAIVDSGLYFSQTIIWHKQWPVLTRKDFMGDHEWCFYGWREGAAHWFNPTVKNAPDVWEPPHAVLDMAALPRLGGKLAELSAPPPVDFWRVRKVSPAQMVHLTEKPVALAERAIGYSSRRGESVLDLFGGSGSTLIAAERMDRKAYLMEIDPAYCDVIISRWEKFTGKKAKRP